MSIHAVHVLTNWNLLYNKQKFSDNMTYAIHSNSYYQLRPKTAQLLLRWPHNVAQLEQ